MNDQFWALLIFGLIINFCISLFWVYATNEILRNKGYKEKWYLFPFFLGLFAFVMASVQTDVTPKEHTIALTGTIRKARYAKLLPSGVWTCVCGKTRSSKTHMCNCGHYRDESIQAFREKREESLRANQKKAEIARQKKLIRLLEKAEYDNIQRVREYKASLDAGTITLLDFEKKKKNLLSL